MVDAGIQRRGRDKYQCRLHGLKFPTPLRINCVRSREPIAGDQKTIATPAVRRADAGCALSSLRVDLAAIRTAHLLASVPLELRDVKLAPVLEAIARTEGPTWDSALNKCFGWHGA
jgi:hypothetical protein